MIIATIIVFGLLFVPLAQTSISGAGSAHISEFFWLPWPLGGLLCGIVALLMKAFGKGAAE